MARTDKRRNVIVVITRDAAGSTIRGRGVEVQDDGTLALGTAKTDANGDLDLLRNQLFQPSGENSALYNPEEIHSVLYVDESQID